MSPSLSTPNTSSTPTSPGRWVITEFGKSSVLKWEAFDPMAALSAGGVLIRILVAGIAGVDNIQRVGGYPHPLAKAPGFTPGYDLVGEIVALGDAIPKTEHRRQSRSVEHLRCTCYTHRPATRRSHEAAAGR